MPRTEEDGGSWLRRAKLYKRAAEPHKKTLKLFIYIELEEHTSESYTN